MSFVDFLNTLNYERVIVNEYIFDWYEKIAQIRPIFRNMFGFLRKVIFSVGVLISVLLILFFVFRNQILHYVLKDVIEKINIEKGLKVVIKESGFSGFSTISLSHVSVVPEAGDTLFTADTLSIRPSVWTILAGTLRIKEVNAEGVLLQIVHKSSGNNYQFLKRNSSTIQSEKSSTKGLGDLLSQLLNKAFNLAPQRASMKNVNFRFVNDTLSRTVRMNDFHSDESSLDGTVEDINSMAEWEWSGKFSQLAHQFDLFIFPKGSQGENLFLLKELTGASLSFDTLHLVLDGFKYLDHELKINGLTSISNFSLQHKKISEDTIKVERASISYSITANDNSISLDSTSVATLGEITIHPFVRLVKDKFPKYSLILETDSVKSSLFFSSLPSGMFDEVKSIEADGTLKFSLRFNLDSEEPDSVDFNCSMTKSKFRIRNYGVLQKINREFSQAVYEKDRYIRTFVVGISNPFYTSYDQISPYFKNAVLTSEDGNFFSHNGFNEDAFRKSIATNYKARKFLRGGSTISMQLVKNVFLNRKKTVARKAEEALIVWLIESNRLVSKARMFEVYCNIIELGPNVYGIGEASYFYFKKRPSEINLQEGIFLSSLLPHPKWFKYSFDAEGNLKPFLSGYYRLVSNFMLKKELISQQEYDNLLPNVKLTGPALNLIIPTDTIFDDNEE